MQIKEEQNMPTKTKILTDDEILRIAEDLDSIRLIGKPKFCLNHNIDESQLVDISNKLGIEIPRYRSIKSTVDVDALKSIIMSAKERKDLNCDQLAKQFGVNHSTVGRMVKKFRPEFFGAEATKVEKKSSESKSDRILKSSYYKADAAAKAVRYLRQHPELTYTAVCKKYKLAYSTLKRYMSANNIDLEKKKVATTVEKQETRIDIPVVKESIVHRGLVDLTKINKEEYVVTAALVAERHEYPTDLAIFDHNLNSDEMFNYRLQETMVGDFIDKWIPFVDGKPAKSLQVYVSGLTCCLSAVIQQCSIRKINLTLWHYNNDIRKYVSQMIFKDFEMAIPSNESFYHTLAKSSKFAGLYTFGLDIKDIVPDKKYLMIRKYIYPTPSAMSYSSVEYVLVEREVDIWQVFGQLLMELKNDRTPGKVVVTPFTITKNGDVIYEKDYGAMQAGRISNGQSSVYRKE